MDALIGSGKKTFLLSDLMSVPQFIRFNKVELYLVKPGLLPMMSLAEKCALFRKHLHDLKLALNDSNSIAFDCYIKRDNDRHFNSHYQFIDYLRDEFLPNCANSRCYKFYICFGSGENENENAATNMIASIIQLAQISRCQNVEIEIDGLFSQQTQLPVEVISSWLAGMYENGVKICNQMKRTLLLSICLGAISNTKEMLDHLEEVSLFYSYYYVNFIFSVGPISVQIQRENGLNFWNIFHFGYIAL